MIGSVAMFKVILLSISDTLDGIEAKKNEKLVVKIV